MTFILCGDAPLDSRYVRKHEEGRMHQEKKEA
jgi:hypothetical protein